MNNYNDSQKILHNIASSSQHYLLAKGLVRKKVTNSTEISRPLVKVGAIPYYLNLILHKLGFTNRYKGTQFVWMKLVHDLVSKRKLHNEPLSSTDKKIIIKAAVRLRVISDRMGKLLVALKM